MGIIMKITNLQTNHLQEPRGYLLEHVTLSWQVSDTEAKRAAAVRVMVALSEQFERQTVIYDSGRVSDYREGAMTVPVSLKPYTEYYWKVWVEGENGDKAASPAACFETGKLGEAWKGQFIGVPRETESMPCIFREFAISKPVKKARAYVCGLGLYECCVNGQKLGEEYLLPGYHSYDLMLQYQTFVLDGMLKQGGNCFEAVLGEGWYKGRFVFEGGYENLYGSHKKLIAELHLWYEDGTKEIFCSDTSFRARESHILKNSIYDGEEIDALRDCAFLPLKVYEGDPDRNKLRERCNPPIRKTESRKPVQILHTPNGGTVLDFGEMMTGWVEFFCREKKGSSIRLSYGEVLQDGNFYRDNLRTAEACFTYKTDGKAGWIRPHFTFYGFRYVLVEGIEKPLPEEFTAFRIMSALRRTGFIRTDMEKVNRLYENTVRSQQCNFLDIPTDCPQRDERMGWTGDTAVFAQTACMHMDCSAFFGHYMRNLELEQQQTAGAVPFFVPRPKPPFKEGMNLFLTTEGACTWGDVASILPWTMYELYRDREELKKQYPAMRSWAAYIQRRSEAGKCPYLWTDDRQLGDWLALDNGNLSNPVGATDTGFIASAYYYHTVELCQKAAAALGEKKEALEYSILAKNIRRAFAEKYIREDGSVAFRETQTAYALLLSFGLCPKGKEKAAAQRLKWLIEENGMHLNTGFAGTPFLCPALTENGLSETAYTLLLNEEYPGWLYEVNLGATTVWERWNSLLPDGQISGTEMNSLNHYAYGSVAGWMYRYLCGFTPLAEGECSMCIAPVPDKRLKWAEGSVENSFGRFYVKWEWVEADTVSVILHIPFNTRALVKLPGGEVMELSTGEYRFLSRPLQQQRECLCK